MAYFIRAASFHRGRRGGTKCSNKCRTEMNPLQFSISAHPEWLDGELTWSSHAFFSFSCASLLFFSSCSFSTAARALAWAFGIYKCVIKKNNYLIGECYADCYADVMLKRKKNNNLGQTHFHSLYLLSPELRLLSGLLAVRTVTVVLQKQAFEGFKTSG